MLNISMSEHRLNVVDIGAGPASFTAEWRGQGGRAIACDPLYSSGADEIENRISRAKETLCNLMEADAHRFVWSFFKSPDDVVEARMAAAKGFLDDFQLEGNARYYLPVGLPTLPFQDEEFDLAVCSHFLFLYSDAFDADFHFAGLMEMTRVAAEVRVFPLLAMQGEYSPHVNEVIDRLRQAGLKADIERVDYEFQKGGNQMLRIQRHNRTPHQSQ
jgi:ubiquinone/menaquinone biosynthesis C-methylase UbiE